MFPLFEVKVCIFLQCKALKPYDRCTVGNLNMSQVNEIQRWKKKGKFIDHVVCQGPYIKSAYKCEIYNTLKS